MNTLPSVRTLIRTREVSIEMAAHARRVIAVIAVTKFESFICGEKNGDPPPPAPTPAFPLAALVSGQLSQSKWILLT